jgi:hypothetical protein
VTGGTDGCDQLQSVNARVLVGGGLQGNYMAGMLAMVVQRM